MPVVAVRALVALLNADTLGPTRHDAVANGTHQITPGAPRSVRRSRQTCF
jgi:hypothetical protein